MFQIFILRTALTFQIFILRTALNFQIFVLRTALKHYVPHHASGPRAVREGRADTPALVAKVIITIVVPARLLPFPRWVCLLAQARPPHTRTPGGCPHPERKHTNFVFLGKGQWWEVVRARRWRWTVVKKGGGAAPGGGRERQRHTHTHTHTQKQRDSERI